MTGTSLFDIPLLLALLLALVPALVQLVSGRRLVRHRQDPALPELVLARARRLGTVTAACVIAMLVVRAEHSWWLFPMMLIALMCAEYPLRRSLHGDVWSFPAYFRYSLFSGVAMLGFWILLALAPRAILGLADGRAVVALVTGLVIAALLVSCDRYYSRFWLALHRAEPVRDQELLRRFGEIAARAGLRELDVRQVGPPGSRILNAIALPSIERPAVAFGRAVMEGFTPDETTAIFAHEAAHLEHFSGPRLRKHGMLSLGLIAAATLLPALMLAFVPAWTTWLPLLILAGVLAVFVGRATSSQANETASDLRALELGARPEALISALTRLHVESHLPRQWPHDFEPTASHPSLARRISAIAERSAIQRASIPGATLVDSLDEGVRILLDEHRLHWHQGVPDGTPDEPDGMRRAATSYRAVAYEDLLELRILARGAARALRATTRSGERLTASVAPVDVARLQRAIADVDVRLGRPALVESTGAALLLAGGVAVALLVSGGGGLTLLAALLVLLRPRVAALAAMGAMAMVHGSLSMFARIGELGTGEGLALILLPLLGAGSLVVAIRRSRAVEARGSKAPYVLLGGVAAACVLLLADRWIRAGVAPSFEEPLNATIAVALLGLGAACLTMRSRAGRRAGLALAAAAAVVALVLGLGASLLGAPPIRIVDANMTGVAELPFRGIGYKLELSPNGGAYAVRRAGYAEPDEWDDPATMAPQLLTLGRIDGKSRRLPVVDALFLDEESLLVLARAGDSLELRVEMLSGSPGPDWRLGLPRLTAPTLLFDASAARWTVIGGTPGESMSAYSGSVGSAERRAKEWRSEGFFEHALHVLDDESLIVASLSAPASTSEILMTAFGSRAPSTRISRRAGDRIDPLGSVPGFPSCRRSSNGALCVTEDGDGTRLWTSDARGAPVPGASLPRGYAVRGLSRSGGVAAISRDGSHVVLIGDSGTEGVRVTLPAPRDGHAILDVQTAGDVLVVLRMTAPGSSSLSVYRVHYPLVLPDERTRTARHTK